MNSLFGNVFLFLTELAWKSRLTIPVLVTTAFLVMDIRLQIEINIQTGQFNPSDMDDDDAMAAHDHGTDESGSDSYTDDLEEYNSEYTNDDGNNSETSHYSMDIYDPWGSDWEAEDDVEANYSRQVSF
ncbi:uncharacterized protein [Drosophila kikkawai]|uniref:Uncharacterized protein isoform X2 n=1 Tax=Drosophila kikkawai TaxID=30033 RepID=A0A6P4IWJ4_DROKI|nr:uncharacterized protein LOC108077743 isoform X2 [Drosophila kikkawai]